jgi:lactate permease
MFSLPTILAIAPFILFLFLLLWRKTPLIWVSGITLLVVALEAVFFWRVFPDYIFGSLIKGSLVAMDIFFIIFGAIFFLEIMRETKIIENIGFHLESISKDIRIQVIFLAWFFENFLEGTAGFGTPSTVVAPLLIGLGISPINAVIIALLGNSSSVVFGAAGTPIRVGLGNLATASLPLTAALINLVGIIVPVFILWFLTVKRQNGKKLFWEALPFALWAGVAFAVPSVLTVFLGQEFPSILGAVIGFGLVLLTTKLKIFVPKNVEYQSVEKANETRLPIIKVLFPYTLLIILLIAGKFLIGQAGIPLPLMIKHTIAYFNPGFAFILAGVLTIGIFRIGTKILASSSKLALKRSIEPFLVIAFMSAIAQIMVNSAHNYSLQPSMIDFMAIHVKNALLPLWAPLVGAFGSFLTGSSTVSNLMFGNFLALSARELGLAVEKILALALVGGAAGNMIALADIMAAEAVVGLRNEEGKVLRGVIIPCLIYIILVGLIGLVITQR